ncbi:MAG: hypothetical protein M1436_04225 [Acidobacteria bacterium]|nr:hypothetical protein [Acidobacteriota bacterium]
MEVELYPLLSTIILVTTVGTIVFALFSYLAYRARARRPPAAAEQAKTLEARRAQLFKRYEPGA